MSGQASHLAAPPLSPASPGRDRRASLGRDRREQSTAGAEYLCRGIEGVQLRGSGLTPWYLLRGREVLSNNEYSKTYGFLFTLNLSQIF